MATDAELNEYVGLKKLAPYAKGKKWDPKGAEKLREFKGKVQERTGGWRNAAANAGDGEGGGEKKRRKGKKERQKAKMADGIPADENGSEAVSSVQTGKRPRDEDTVMDDQDPESKKRKKRRRSHATTDAA